MIRHNWYFKIFILCILAKFRPLTPPTQNRARWSAIIGILKNICVNLAKLGSSQIWFHCSLWMAIASPLYFTKLAKKKRKEKKRPLGVSPLLLFLFLELSFAPQRLSSLSLSKFTQKQSLLVMFSHSLSLSLAHAHARTHTHKHPHTPNIDRRVDERFNTWCG